MNTVNAYDSPNITRRVVDTCLNLTNVVILLIQIFFGCSPSVYIPVY